MKKKMVLCTKIPEKRMQEIEEYCDITIAGELKHGKGNVTEEQTCRSVKDMKLLFLEMNMQEQIQLTDGRHPE